MRRAAEATLKHQHYVRPIDVLLGIGLLQTTTYQDWRRGRIPYLEQVIQGNLGKISFAMKCFRSWAQGAGLKASPTAYVVKTRGSKRDLRFSKSGDPKIEEAYRTHYTSPLLSEKKQERLRESWEKSPDLVVFMIIKSSLCSQCQEELLPGNFLFKEEESVLCITCAGFGDLVFLPRGNAKLTRRAKQYSTQCNIPCLVVVRFSRARKRYERQGILITKEALEKAECETEDVIQKNWVPPAFLRVG